MAFGIWVYHVMAYARIFSDRYLPFLAIFFGGCGGGGRIPVAGSGGDGGDGTDTQPVVENMPFVSISDRLAVLRGTGGDDFFTSALHSDRFDGQGGADMVSYQDSPAAVEVDLTREVQTGGAESHAAGDRLVSIESLRGSAHDDTLYGDDSANLLDGGGGKDEMLGRAGADIFVLELAAPAADVVLDFSRGEDRLQLDIDATAYAATPENARLDFIKQAADLSWGAGSASSGSGQSLYVSADGVTVMELVAVDDLAASDFLIV